MRLCFCVVLPIVLASVILGAGIGSAEERPGPPKGTVPEPPEIAVKDLPDPHPWVLLAGNDSDPVRLEPALDLDLLAPLGNGVGDAATWFAPFAGEGKRSEEWAAAEDRIVTRRYRETENRVLPGDDPLLLEAEPWVDQASCSFYPEYLAVEGLATKTPNLSQMLTLGRSWIARGHAQHDPAAALADYRRIVRLGRLLLQDDVTLMQDLVGMALIRMGAEAIYDEARSQGNGAMTTLAALAALDITALRLETIRRSKRLEGTFPWPEKTTTLFGKDAVRLVASDEEVEQMIGIFEREPDRALKHGHMTALWLLHGLGTREQRDRAEQVLKELAEGTDPILAAAAQHALERPVTPEDFSVMKVLGGS
ncbi:MAG: hypothetical protein GY906_14265 [bacterium]|nr:hypothetical protein [bacterium]